MTTNFIVYVLQSTTTGRTYTGHTSDLNRRLSEHRLGITHSTKSGKPWKLVYKEELATRSEAVRRERYLKTGKGREELKRRLSAAP